MGTLREVSDRNAAFMSCQRRFLAPARTALPFTQRPFRRRNGYGFRLHFSSLCDTMQFIDYVTVQLTELSPKISSKKGRRYETIAADHRKFYDKTGLTFPIGNIRCHALKFSFEQLHRSFPATATAVTAGRFTTSLTEKGR